MSAKLIVDLEKCRQDKVAGIECSYKHHPENEGFNALLEMIRFALICRRCHSAPCINACPQGALEKLPSETGDDEGMLKRANMLCSGCGSCAVACPFGTLYTDLVPFPSSVCDVCRGRLSEGEKPLCVRTSQDGILDYKEVEVTGDMIEVFPDIVVKVAGGTRWEPFLRETEEAGK